MKCIRCGHDSRYRERTDRKCPQCHGSFAFEPQAGDPVTDLAFQRAIEAVSAGGRVRWGVEHLYYEICRRKRLSPTGIAVLIGIAIAFGVVAAILALTHEPAWWAGVLVVALVVLGMSAERTRAPLVRVDGRKFNHLWERWCKVHGTPAGVIVRQPAPRHPPDLEPDLGDYSFDRAVICDRARTVDLLLANNFHFENNCAVLSIDGYPPGPFPTVRAMLRRNPRLQAFALHDATPAGCTLAHRLASDPDWFASRVRVVDVGLRPGHAKKFQGLLLQAKNGDVDVGDGVTASEALWLSRYVLELAAYRPEQVLKRLFRAINQTLEPDGETGSVIYLGDGGDGSSSTVDAGGGDGPADSFG